jgi:hypothetical protein
VLKLRKHLGEQAAQAVISGQEARRPVPDPGVRPVSARCTKRYEGADQSIFPLDEQLELWEHHGSESVVKYAVWLSGLVTYEEAAAILTQDGEIPIAASSVWRRVKV